MPKYSKNRGVFRHVTNDEMAFLEVISGDMPSCLFTSNLNVLFKRNKDISSCFHATKYTRILEHFSSLSRQPNFERKEVPLEMSELLLELK